MGRVWDNGLPKNFLCLMLRHNLLCALLLERKLQVLNVRFMCEEFELHTGLPYYYLIGIKIRITV
jgi:hypothetical protein